MGLVIAPIPEGKEAQWAALMEDSTTSKKAEFEDFNKRYGIERHRVWHATTPAGAFAVVLHEGPGADSFMQKLGSSDNPFDIYFREQIAEIHGMDVTKPPPGPPPELKLNYGG